MCRSFHHFEGIWSIDFSDRYTHCSTVRWWWSWGCPPLTKYEMMRGKRGRLSQRWTQRWTPSSSSAGEALDCTHTDVHLQCVTLEVGSKHAVRYNTHSMFLRGMRNAKMDVGTLMVKVRRGLGVSEVFWKPTLSSNHLLSLQQGCTQQQQVKQSHKTQNVSRPHVDSSQQIPLKITRCAARIR